ncbi:MAG: pyridoxal phosphate-dependent aminotransferase [Calditrichaeota bacterium]|nr:MAG: pyridoxal phosphate-dependent aminotransferase [Calditrichota bacterium]
MKFSENVQQINESETFAFFAKMKAKIRQGADVIPLVAGELDYTTPPSISKGAIEAIDEGFTKYTVNSGILELRESICQKLQKDNSLIYQPDQILVSNGVKQSLFNILFALCGKGDEVIILAPYWPSYPSMVKMTGATPVYVDTSDTEFRPSIERFKNAITDRTKMVIINSPNNPTGIVYKKETLTTIAEIVKEHDLWLMSDEIYEKIIFAPAVHYTPSQLIPEIHDKTIVVNGFSKSYAMTGWRVGYAAGPEELIKKAGVVQSHTTSNVCSIAQKAALKALDNGDDFVNQILPDLKEQYTYTTEFLHSIPGIKTTDPSGAFYFFFPVHNYIKKKFKGKVIENTTELADYLMDEHNVALVPGVAFGTPGYLRLSYTVKLERLKIGLEKIKAGLLALE